MENNRLSHEDLMIPGLSPSSRASTNPFDNDSIGDSPVQVASHSELTESVADTSQAEPPMYSMRGGMISGNVVDATEELRKVSKKEDVESGSLPPDSDYASRGPRSIWDASTTVGRNIRDNLPSISLPVPRFHSDANDPGKRRRYLRVLVAVAVVVFALAVVAVVFLIRSSRQDTGSNQSRESAIDHILENLSTSQDLNTKETPQYRARQWLIHHDALQLNPLGNATAAHVAQRYTLATFYFSTGGDKHWSTNNWMKGNECDGEHWNFLDCNEEGEVRAMVFEGIGLTGQLPPELGHLSKLVSFIVKGEEALHGRLPSSFGKLGAMEQLGISFTSVEGTIPPEIFLATNMRFLNLRNNQLEGTIPTEIGVASSLGKLILSNNRFNGTIPWNSLPLSFLQLIALSNNQLTGPIDPVIEDFPELSFLYLEKNKLSGRIPPEIGYVSNLRSINLDHNNLKHTLPGQIGLLSRLEYLSIQYNQLTGALPTGIKNLKKLKTLALGENSLTGGLPDFYPLTKLKYLYLFGNDFNGVVPAYLYDLMSLEVLFLSSNNFTGPILVNSRHRTKSRLKGLYLSDNQFNGPVPESICSFKTLEAVFLDENDLSGRIPPCISELSQLVQFYVFNNQVQGEIPVELSTLVDLVGMGFENNNITGNVPQDVCELVDLNSIELWADCGGDNPDVSCECCTVCCPGDECS